MLEIYETVQNEAVPLKGSKIKKDITNAVQRFMQGFIPKGRA